MAPLNIVPERDQRPLEIWLVPGLGQEMSLGRANLPAAEEADMSEAVASGTQSHVEDRQGWDRRIGHSTASM